MPKLVSVTVLLVAWSVAQLLWTALSAWALPEGLLPVPGHVFDTPGHDDTAVELSQLLKKVQQVVSFGTTSQAVPRPFQRLRDLVQQPLDPRTFSLRGTSSFFDGHLLTESEISHSPSMGLMGQGSADASHRLLRFGATGRQGPVQYGLTYRSAGQASLGVRDQAMREVWGEWQLGLARWRASRSETWNNLNKDPTRARVLQTQENTTLTVAPAAWPEVSVSYGRTWWSSALVPAGQTPLGSHLDTFEGSLAMTRPGWTARFASLYSVNADDQHAGRKTAGVTYAVSGSYQPRPSLTFTPTVSVRDDRQQWTGVRIHTLGAGLSVTYAPEPAWTMTTTSAYSGTQSTDGRIDLSSITAKSVMAWTVQPVTAIRCAVSLDTGYRHALDRIHPAGSLEDLYGLLRVQIGGR